MLMFGHDKIPHSPGGREGRSPPLGDLGGGLWGQADSAWRGLGWQPRVLSPKRNRRSGFHSHSTMTASIELWCMSLFNLFLLKGWDAALLFSHSVKNTGADVDSQSSQIFSCRRSFAVVPKYSICVSKVIKLFLIQIVGVVHSEPLFLRG